jgi:signal transduction histidine kinase/CheY-like chemotaxis protein
MEKPFYQLNKYIQIMVADDNEDLRKQWCWFLEGEGYRTCEATSAEEVIAQIDKAHIVLLDYYIDGSPTGPELIKKIRELREKNLTIIIITGQVDLKEKTECLNAGATAFFVKGTLDFNDVLPWIREITYRIWLEGILNAMPDQVLLLGRDSTIIWANEAKRKRFRLPDQPDTEIIGKAYLGTLEVKGEVDPIDSRFALGSPSKYAMDNVATVRTEWKFQHPIEKQYRWIELSVGPIKDSRGQVIAAAEVARDITSKKEMHDYLSFVVAKRNWHDRLNLFLEGIEKLRGKRSRLYLRMKNETQFKLVATRGMENFKTSKSLDISSDAPTYMLQEIQLPMLIEIDTKNPDRDLEKDKTVIYLWHEGANKRRTQLKNVKQWLELPLLAPDEDQPGKWFLFGKVSVDKGGSVNRFNSYEIQLLSEYANLGSEFINNARVQEELELYYDLQSAFLLSEQEILNIGDDKKTLFRKAVNRVCELIDTRVCCIFEWDEKKQELVRVHSYGKSVDGKTIKEEQFPPETYKMDEGLMGTLFSEWRNSNKPRLIRSYNDLQDEKNLNRAAVKRYEELISEKITTVIHASLGTPDKPFGWLRAANRVHDDEFGDRKFKKRDEEMFEALAAQISLAISNLRLLESYQKAQKEKENFLQILTHQLRAPVANVLQITDNMLQKNFPREKINESVDKIQESIHYFKNVIQNFETVVQRAKLPDPNLKLLKVGPILRKCVNLLLLNDAVVIANAVDALPEIDTDADRLDQIFINLLDNARKYTISKKAKIRIEAENNEHAVAIAIINTGPIIANHEINRILEFGERLKEAKAISTTGSGIGLTATKIVLDHLNGELKITSTPLKRGKASNNFKVILPKRGRST